MSAVLQSPTLPMLAALEERFNAMEARIKSLEKENTGIKAELLETKELLAISLRRNTQLENALFLHDSEGEIIKDKDNQPVLNVTKSTEKQIEPIASKNDIIPKTSLEHKALKLIETLRFKPRSRNGETFMDNSDLTNFLTNELPESLRSEDSNLRRVKKRVIDKAKSLFPECIQINKSKYGRHETRIIFKESYLCKGTVR
jgi:hypothetical protein